MNAAANIANIRQSPPVDAISLAYNEKLLRAARTHTDGRASPLLDSYERMLVALRVQIRRDRSQLLLVAGNVAGSLAQTQHDDRYVAQRSVALARTIVAIVDEEDL